MAAADPPTTEIDTGRKGRCLVEKEQIVQQERRAFALIKGSGFVNTLLRGISRR
ncbi:MAG TPA: hypothetical protein PK177_01070 [Burkholderiaceae bacterium]|nr:hypothetical protein [Burkholderiaceae bacterium]